MPDDLIMPLIMATLFTAGCYLIRRLEQHAEAMGHLLTTALVCVMMLVLIAMLANSGGLLHARSEGPALRVVSD